MTRQGKAQESRDELVRLDEEVKHCNTEYAAGRMPLAEWRAAMALFKLRRREIEADATKARR